MNGNNQFLLLQQLAQNGRMKIVLYALVIAVLALIVEVFIWSAAKFENTNLHDDVAAERNRLYRQAQLQKLDTHLQISMPLVESIEKKYKSATSQSDVMRQLNGLVRSHHLRMHSQSIAALAGEDNASSINSIELRVSGRYVDLRSMLGKLSTMNAWVEVADIRIERMNASDVGAQVRLLLIKESAQ